MTRAPSSDSGRTFFFRGFGYALTSILAVLSSLLLNAARHPRAEHLLAVPLLILPIPFFLIYAKLFDYRSPHTADADAVRYEDARFYLSYFVVPLASAIPLLVFWKLSSQPLPWTVLIAVAIYAALLFSYGCFLNIVGSRQQAILMRHQLIWPALLTIAVPLYLGLTFDLLTLSLLPLWPVLALLLVFLLSQALNLNTRHFLFGTILLVSLLLAASVSYSNEYLSAMAFAVIVTAYLAVFEAWQITAHIVRRQKATPASDPRDLVLTLPPQSAGQPATEPSVSRFPVPFEYYSATMAALSLSGVLLPLVYTFTDFGTLFLMGATLHVVCAFTYWSVRSRRDLSGLATLNWVPPKLFFGFAFLTLLVLDSFLKRHPSAVPLSSDLVSFGGGASFLFMLAGFPIATLTRACDKLARNLRTDPIRTRLMHLFSEWRNAAWTSALLSAVLCVLVLFLRLFAIENLPAKKSQYAFLAYTFLIIITFIVWVSTKFGPFWSGPAGSVILGLAQTVRVPTSLAIATLVFLPLIFSGCTPHTAVLAATPFLLAAMGGFALNDYFDRAKDAVNKPHRAIPSGRLKASAVLCLGTSLLFAGGIAVFSISTTFQQLLYSLLAVFGVILYNPIVRYFAPMKTLLAAALCTLPLLFVILAVRYPRVYFLLPVASFFFIVGRECLMDICDLRGDAIAGSRTLPMIIGQPAVKYLALGLILFAVSILLPLAIMSSAHMSLWLITGLTALSCMFLLVRDLATQRTVILLLWIPLLSGMLMLLVN